MYKIFSPVKDYSGSGYGLTFVNGEAQTENRHIVEHLRARGYTVEGGEEGKALERMTVEELKAAAADRGAEIPAGAKKPDIIEIIRAADAEKGDA